MEAVVWMRLMNNACGYRTILFHATERGVEEAGA